MTIYLCKNKSDPNNVTKTVTKLKKFPNGLEGCLRDETDLLNPVITFEINIEDLYDCNYVEIPVFGRRYFVTGMRSIRTHLVEISCHVDVLGTYATDILKLPAVIERQQSVYNMYLTDSRIPTVVKETYQTLNFPNEPITSRSLYFLVVQGRAGSVSS